MQPDLVEPLYIDEQENNLASISRPIESYHGKSFSFDMTALRDPLPGVSLDGDEVRQCAGFDDNPKAVNQVGADSSLFYTQG